MKYIYLATFEPVDRDIMDAMEEAVWRVFGTETRRIEFGGGLGFAHDPYRDQYNSVVALREVHRRSPTDSLKVLAVTDRDLFIPMLSFVFGQAQLGGSAALVSTARLRQEFYGLPADPALTAVRAVKEMIHELGHTFGLTHCGDAACPMALANNVIHADRKGAALCGACAEVLMHALMAWPKT